MSKVNFGEITEPVAGVPLVDWADGATVPLMMHRPIENHQPVDWNNDPVVIYAKCARGIVVRHVSRNDLEEIPKCRICHSGQPFEDFRKRADSPAIDAINRSHPRAEEIAPPLDDTLLRIPMMPAITL